MLAPRVEVSTCSRRSPVVGPELASSCRAAVVDGVQVFVATNASSRRSASARPARARPARTSAGRRVGPASTAASTTSSATSWRPSSRSRVVHVPRPTTGRSTPARPEVATPCCPSTMARASLWTPRLTAARVDGAPRASFPVVSVSRPAARRRTSVRCTASRGSSTTSATRRGRLLGATGRARLQLDRSPRTEIMRRLHATIAERRLSLEPFHRLVAANRIDQGEGATRPGTTCARTARTPPTRSAVSCSGSTAALASRTSSRSAARSAPACRSSTSSRIPRATSRSGASTLPEGCASLQVARPRSLRSH